MEGNVRKMFPGGNTSKGFKSFFDYVIPKNVNIIFCMKGGPGVGKSSLMKKVAKEMINRGYDVDLYPCSSDPNSLDAIVIKDLGAVMLDATAPHIVDPKNPGAIDEILDLGRFWNRKGIEDKKEEVLECNKEVSRFFKMGFKYFEAAAPIAYEIQSKNIDCMDFGGVNELTSGLIESIFENCTPNKEYKPSIHLFGSALSPIGHVEYTDTILKDIDNIYYLEGDLGTGKSTLLNKIASKSEEYGIEVELFHAPLLPEKIETIVIKDLEIAITTSELFKHNNKKSIDLNSFMDKEKHKKYKEELEFSNNILEELVNYGLLNITRAKEAHDKLEEYYIPNMDFDKVNELKDLLIERIISYN
ncbi:ATP-binding protein [Paraclostridium bifermentans]|uniref:ATP-binding protein n=1 Tax=Paraclostridium bifermentans TaxID=1490 RepID=UPI00359C2AEB